MSVRQSKAVAKAIPVREGRIPRSRRARTGKCRICFPFAGGLVGGSHISALKLIQALDRSEFEPVVLLHSEEGPLATFLDDAGVRFGRTPPVRVLQPHVKMGMRDFARIPGDVAILRRFLRDQDIGIVHTNEGAMHATWSLPARLAGARHIWHHRGNSDAVGLRLSAPLLASRVLCVSDYAAPRPGLWSARPKSSTIYSPFDSAAADLDRQAARAEVEQRLGLASGTTILSFLGQFSSRKRPLVFVETIAALRQLRPDLPLVGLLFGEEFEPGIEAAIRQRIADLGVADIVRLMGFQRPIEQWLAASCVNVVPAVGEPFGRTLIEAMLLGTPVVAAASGGNLEAIRHRQTGLLARVDDPADLAAKVLELIEDPGLADAIGHRARIEASRKFSVGNHVREVTTIYRKVLAA